MGRGKPHKKSSKSADSQESRKPSRGNHGSSRRGGRGRGFRNNKSPEDDGEEHGGKPHRLLESNWGRYEDEPEEFEDHFIEEYDETKDFEYVKQHAGGASSHFQFKDEKELQEELSTTSQNGASILDLDLEQLSNHVSTLNLMEVLSLQELVGDLDIRSHFHHLMSGEGVSGEGVSHDESEDDSSKGSNFSLDDNDEILPSWNYEGIEQFKSSLLVDHLSTTVNVPRKCYEKTPALSSEEKNKNIDKNDTDEEETEHLRKHANEVILNDSACSDESDHATDDDVRMLEKLTLLTTTDRCEQDENINVATVDIKMTANPADMSLQDVLGNDTCEDDTVDFLDELLNDTCQTGFNKTGEKTLPNDETFDLDDLLSAVPLRD